MALITNLAHVNELRHNAIYKCNHYRTIYGYVSQIKTRDTIEKWSICDHTWETSDTQDIYNCRTCDMILYLELSVEYPTYALDIRPPIDQSS